jgi:hypothetical protein
MKIKVNDYCNVKTGFDTCNPRVKTEITVPHLRINIQPSEARTLAAALLEAAQVAEDEAEKIRKANQ